LKLNRKTFIRTSAALAALAGPGIAKAQDLPTLRVAGPPLEGFTVMHYGVRSGLFRRHGVNVEIVPINSGSAATAALLGGSVHVAWPTAVALFQAHLRGFPLRIIAPGDLYRTEAPVFILFVKGDSPIRDARGLNGKTIATTSLKDLNWVGISAWADSNGGDSSTFKLIELPSAAVVPAIAEGRIDAANVATPYMEQGTAAGTIRPLAKAFDTIGKRFLLGLFISTVDAIAANRDAMTRFVSALHEATLYLNAHLGETADLVASFTGMDAAVVRRSTRTLNAEYVDVADLQPLMDALVKYKVIERSFPVEELFGSVMLRRG
jgi:NitT/TauT family transport system substrate-binding protein